MKQWIDMFNKRGKIYEWRYIHRQQKESLVLLSILSKMNLQYKIYKEKKLHWKNCALKTVDEMSERKFIQNEAAATECSDKWRRTSPVKVKLYEFKI